MAAGDANRIWFPEIVDELRKRWRDDLDANDLMSLAENLNTSLQQLRSSRNIKPAMMWCPRCKERHRSAPPRVSVRATILAAKRFEVATLETAKKMERQWTKHRRVAGLDPYGQPTEAEHRDQ